MSEISPLVRLVDDDDAFRESQKLFLSMCGYEVKDWADPVRFLEEDDPRVMCPCLIGGTDNCPQIMWIFDSV